MDVDIKTKKRLNETRYKNISFSHVRPSRDSLVLKEPPDKWEEGLFVRGRFQIFFNGEMEPVGNILNKEGIIETSELEISKEGKWAAFVTSENGLYLIDGEKRILTQISKEWCHSISWQPEVK